MSTKTVSSTSLLQADLQLPRNSAVLTLSCEDRQGIVAAVSSALSSHGCNITEAAQYLDEETNRFFMRIAYSMEAPDDGQPFSEAFEAVAKTFEMTSKIADVRTRVPTILMVSKLGHCLHDLLLRWQTALLPIDIKAIVSNHKDFYQLAASYNIPFHYIPVTPSTRSEAEAALMNLVRSEGVELVVLARYMQVLSNDLCRQLEGRAINIHHSFLPGFKGAKPYSQAHARGVKLIGATAHYVTGELDEGPIIEQGVERAGHALSPAALTMIGRDIESVTLARAVKWHCEHRVLFNGMKTVVFN
jgi:formyltetrahydrofolate deformylase